jgi:aspartate racemase
VRYLGLLGGMSWESTAEYYRLLNRGVAERVGGLHSAPLVMHSVDFAAIATLQQQGEWKEAGAVLARAAQGLEAAGAEAMVLATNTMHQVASEIEAAISIPLLHIVDATGKALRPAGVRTVGLLGTRYTMELPFWRERLAERFDIALVVPEPDERATVHRIIFEELCLGRTLEPSRQAYAEIIGSLGRRGADGIVLGCTEISLLIKPGDVPQRLFDTTALHVEAALEFALASTV